MIHRSRLFGALTRDVKFQGGSQRSSRGEERSKIDRVVGGPRQYPSGDCISASQKMNREVHDVRMGHDVSDTDFVLGLPTARRPRPRRKASGHRWSHWVGRLH